MYGEKTKVLILQSCNCTADLHLCFSHMHFVSLIFYVATKILLSKMRFNQLPVFILILYFIKEVFL